MTQAAPSLSDQLRAQASAEQPLPYRQAPHNIDAEQALLGAILVNNEALDRVSGFLKPEHFYDPLHGQIYETIGQLIHMGKNATPITLRTFFENAEPIEPTLTVPQYLGRLAVNATSIINAADYGRTIYDLSVRRQLITVGEDVVNAAFDSPVDSSPEKQIQEAEGRLYALAETGKYGKGFVSFGEALLQSVEMAGAAYERDGGLSGISTGLVDLDRQMGGLQRSDLIVLAGRPSMGKTALATNIAWNIAKAYQEEKLPDGTTKTKNGGKVGFFSLEMSAEQLASRVLSEQAQIASQKIRRGMINEDEFRRLVEVSQKMSVSPLFIDQTGGITIAQLAARSRKLKRQHGLDLLVVDSLFPSAKCANWSQNGHGGATSVVGRSSSRQLWNSVRRRSKVASSTSKALRGRSSSTPNASRSTVRLKPRSFAAASASIVRRVKWSRSAYTSTKSLGAALPNKARSLSPARSSRARTEPMGVAIAACVAGSKPTSTWVDSRVTGSVTDIFANP